MGMVILILALVIKDHFPRPGDGRNRDVVRVLHRIRCPIDKLEAKRPKGLSVFRLSGFLRRGPRAHLLTNFASQSPPSRLAAAVFSILREPIAGDNIPPLAVGDDSLSGRLAIESVRLG